MLADMSQGMVGHKQITDNLTNVWKARFKKAQQALEDVEGMERLQAFSEIMVRARATKCSCMSALSGHCYADGADATSGGLAAAGLSVADLLALFADFMLSVG